jgi:hypothetical protein
VVFINKKLEEIRDSNLGTSFVRKEKSELVAVRFLSFSSKNARESYQYNIKNPRNPHLRSGVLQSASLMKNLNIFNAPVRPNKDKDHRGPASFRDISVCNEWFASNVKKNHHCRQGPSVVDNNKSLTRLQNTCLEQCL